MQVTLKMKDEMSGQVVTRTIDAINAMDSSYPCWELKDKNSQRKNLERWIAERGNDQHETILTLIEWKFH